MRCMIPLTVIASFLLVFPACDKDGSPTGPDGGGAGKVTLTPAYMTYSGGFGISLQYHIAGSAMDTTLTTYPYVLADVPADTYTVTCTATSRSGEPYDIIPPSRTVNATSGLVEIDPFLLILPADRESLEANSLGILRGRLRCRSMVRDAFTISLSTLEGDIIGRTTAGTYESANYSFRSIPYGSYRVTPSLSMFEFEPSDPTVTIDEIFTVANFTATYTGPEPHTISCRILGDVQDFEGYLLVQLLSSSLLYYVLPDSTGYVETLPLIPGEYHITVRCSAAGGSSSEDWEEIRQFTVIISDSDIDLGVIENHYIGPMYYNVSGKVTDADGNGIEGVTIRISNTGSTHPVDPRTITKADGTYEFPSHQLSTRTDLLKTVTASKSGWVFDPPSIDLAHAYDRTLTRVYFTADFIAAPVELVTAP